MQRYFYLISYFPITKKVLKEGTPKTHTEYKCHLDERNDFIKKFGEEAFNEACKNDERMAKLNFLPIPKPYNWLFSHFTRIYKYASSDAFGNKRLLPIDIINYCNCFNVDLTIGEKKLIFLMNDWATETVSELKTNQ